MAFAADTLAEAIGALVMSSKPSEEGGGLIVTLVHMCVVLIRVRISGTEISTLKPFVFVVVLVVVEWMTMFCISKPLCGALCVDTTSY